MYKDAPAWLTAELEWGLRETAAPAELWNRIAEARRVAVEPRKGMGAGLVWAMAATVALMAVGLSFVYRESTGNDRALAMRALSSASQISGFRCENPAQLRAWVRAKTGLDLPLRQDAAPSIQLIGAQAIEGARGVEVAYRAGSRDAVLLVSKARGAANSPHDRASGSVSSWIMDGQRYTLACDNPADLQLACKLCHLD